MHINGMQLAVERNGAGPALLMLHGIGGTTNVYQVQAEILARHHEVIRLDFAGAGRSPVAGPITILSHARNCVAVLDMLDVKDVVVVGHSMGTLVARELARTHPERVRGVVLLAPVNAPAPTARQAIRDRAAILRERGAGAIVDQILERSLAPATRAQRPELAAFVRELVMRQDREGYAANNEALAGATDPGPVATELPLLIAVGAEDALGSPAVAGALAERHGNARTEIIDGVGHWIPIEAAQRTTELLCEFLAAGA